ncbi:MAG TPA: hypothetical protein VEC37_05205, partial [Bacillota bacterium]|nr:hypothetical protein [Bacillota bacterium]
YRFDTHTEEVENRCQKVFDVPGNVDSGQVVNAGNGALYRELVNGSYVEGALKYLKKDGSSVTIANQCIYYSVSPDKKRVLAGGNDPDDPVGTEKKFYLYNLVTEKKVQLTQVFCPQTLEELLGVEASWNRDSRYVSLIDKVIDADAKGTIKKDFEVADALMTMFCWSPDGQKLAFLYQSASNAEYSIDLENSSICLSDRIGIYNTWDGSIRYVDIPNGLAVDLVWGDDSKELIARVVPTSKLETFIGNYQPENVHPSEHMEYFDLIVIDLNQGQTRKVLADYPVRSVNKYYENKLLLIYWKKGHSYIGVYDLNTKVFKDLIPGNSLLPYNYRSQVIITVPEGVYLLNQKLNIKRVVQWDQCYPIIIFPEQQTVVYNTNECIKIVDLAPPNSTTP